MGNRSAALFRHRLGVDPARERGPMPAFRDAGDARATDQPKHSLARSMTPAVGRLPKVP